MKISELIEAYEYKIMKTKSRLDTALKYKLYTICAMEQQQVSLLEQFIENLKEMNNG